MLGAQQAGALPPPERSRQHLLPAAVRPLAADRRCSFVLAVFRDLAQPAGSLAGRQECAGVGRVLAGRSLSR